ncbi:MAG: FKBP-type peptidyl-prolyl cis-trans isomerase [Nitrososphaeria archaeon]
MPFEQGTLVYVNLTGIVKETNELIETTLEDKAKEYNVFDPTRKYRPRLIAIGEKWVLEPLDDKLKEMNVGEKLSIEIPPEKAFGVWDPSKVKVIPLRKLGERATQLRVGDEVEIDNRIGRVKLLASGRVHIDFNHKYSGKTIVYEVQVVKELKEDSEKIEALFLRRIPIEEEKVKFSIQDNTVVFELPFELYLEEGLQIVKRALANDIFKFLPNIQKVTFIENYEKQKSER